MVKRNIEVDENQTKEERQECDNNIQMAISGCYRYFLYKNKLKQRANFWTTYRIRIEYVRDNLE